MRKYRICGVILILFLLCAACGAERTEEEGENIPISEGKGIAEVSGISEAPCPVNLDDRPVKSDIQAYSRMSDSAMGIGMRIITGEKTAFAEKARHNDDEAESAVREEKAAAEEGKQKPDGGEILNSAWPGDAHGGALSVEGTKLVDGSGNPVQLKGISTHGLAWYPDYVNRECIRQLKDEWGMNVFRLAMYTAEYGGYCSGGNREELKALVKNGVDYATENEMYVIIDWHILSDGNPNTYLEEAKDFFGEMSEEYADHSNVLYEICNEPNGGVSWSEIKSYGEQVIEVIRENDPDGIILVGTPNWSQYVDQAAADPIQGYDNIMYTLHFYAATHREELRNTMIRAVEAGLPVFVSEYGICDASGNGGIDEYQADQWVETMNTYQISYVAWNLSNKGETSAIIKNSCNKVSGFTEEDLSDSGKWLRRMLGGALFGESAGTSPAEEPASGSSAGASGAEEPVSGEPAGTSGTEEPVSKEPAGTSGEEGESSSGKADISVQAVNSWGQGQESFYQYSLTITNLTEMDMKEWKVSLLFDGDIILNNSWNGNYQVEGNLLTITSMDYNGHIEKDGSVDNIGFIVQGQEGMGVPSALE